MSRINDVEKLIAKISRGTAPSMTCANAIERDGHLLPDLPEPVELDGITYFGDHPQICAYRAGQVYVLDNGWWERTTPAALRDEAAAMLAAADYAERNQE